MSDSLTENIEIELVIPEESAGKRIDAAISELVSKYSREKIKDWINSGECLVNGKKVKPKDKAKGLEQVIIKAELVDLEKWNKPESIEFEIMFEDEDVIVVNKHPGLVVHPGAGNPSGTLVNALLYHDASLAKVPRAGIIHRLDKDTSGLMIVAKNLPSQTFLSEQMQSRKVKRSYQAVVYGEMIAGGTISEPIGRHPKDKLKMAVVSTGKHATTHYLVRKSYKNYTHVDVKLETGRTHQIRVHMAKLGYPLVGDELYSGSRSASLVYSEQAREVINNFKRQGLHAYKIAFVHPVTKKEMIFETPLPEDMQKLLKVIKDDDVNKLPR